MKQCVALSIFFLYCGAAARKIYMQHLFSIGSAQTLKFKLKVNALEFINDYFTITVEFQFKLQVIYSHFIPLLYKVWFVYLNFRSRLKWSHPIRLVKCRFKIFLCLYFNHWVICFRLCIWIKTIITFINIIFQYTEPKIR